ncbi:hypothetical protein AB1Y20_014765 [Prymnesium parvum]|uniref:Uncharacterized protein n=1 Tax=Prymnesium parvum TaxID=97485 RepID=A0AB34IF53_PRYPA
MRLAGLLALFLPFLIHEAAALRPALLTRRPHAPATPVRCLAGKETAGQGFGQKKASQRREASAPPAAATPPPPLAAPPEKDGLAGAEARGRLALEKLRAQSGQPAPSAARPRLSAEELTPLNPSDGVMPQVVSDRMLRRVVPFAGLPIAGAALIFGGFFYANTQLGLDLPPQLVAYATQLCVLLSFAGITWGVMSTSWDEEVEGSLLGIEQVGKNFNLMRGVDEQRREEARVEYAESDAADDGVIMNRAQLAKQEKHKKPK